METSTLVTLEDNNASSSSSSEHSVLWFYCQIFQISVISVTSCNKRYEQKAVELRF